MVEIDPERPVRSAPKLTVNERQTNQSCGHPHGWPIRPKPVVESAPNRAQSLDVPMSRDAAHRCWVTQCPRTPGIGDHSGLVVDWLAAIVTCQTFEERRQDEIRYQLV